ncbi:MAG TPA: energy transducer TonB [Candidatus Acidoferrum sp.]|nr:energy transducer TonB [Candidatus Acidoferrum sp.]
MLPGLSCRARFGIAALTIALAATFADAQSALNLSRAQESQLYDLASRILKHADAAGCKKNSCTILVNNFAGPSGATTPLGMQLADALSLQLASQGNEFHVVDRAKFREFLGRERIESKLLEDDNAARWLAKENGANVVLVGYLRGDSAQKNLHVQLLDTRDFAKKSPKATGHAEEAAFSDLGFAGDLDPAEPFGKPPDLPGSDTAFKFGKGAMGKAVTPPRCTYMPNPSYSDPARAVKLQGVLVVQVLISESGAITDEQVVKGLPFGLNAQALETVKNWRCDPVTVNGQPKAVVVPIEVSFRLY